MVTEDEVHTALRELHEVKGILTNIERLLRKMPEIQAAVFLQMQEVATDGQFQGIKAADLWEVAPPAQR